MVPPRFSAWSSFILGGLGGWRGGGEAQPEWLRGGGPPPWAQGGVPPGAPSDVPVPSVGYPGPPFSIPEQSSTSLPIVPTLSASGTGTRHSTEIPSLTTSAAHTASYTTVPGSDASHSACDLPTSPLTNVEQVGESVWGTLCQQPLKQWLDRPDSAEYTSPPWGNHTTRNTDPTIQGDIPVTHVTRHYNWTISRSRISPDGVLRDVILVNDQFPGPLIEANYGDWIEVHVHNNISGPEEGTAMHWHGILQRGTPWMDGTPGVAQCPIAPGESYTYRFRAEVYGTTFWHAHYSAQYTAGAAGPLVIHGPSVKEYDVDLGPVMLSDCVLYPARIVGG